MPISIIALILTAISILIPIAMGMIKLAWYLKGEISKIELSLHTCKSTERDWTETKIKEMLLDHKGSCRAAQDAGDLISVKRRI